MAESTKEVFLVVPQSLCSQYQLDALFVTRKDEVVCVLYPDRDKILIEKLIKEYQCKIITK